MNPRSACVAICLVLSLRAAATVSAQSPSDAAILVAASDAVGREASTSIARAEDPVAEQVQIGLAELDRYLKTGNRQVLERSLFRFNQAAARRTDWAWPEFAMAHTFLVLHDKQAPQLPSEGAREGEAYIEAMWRHLLEALRREPDFPRARALLSDLTYASGDRELRPDTREALAMEVARRDARADALIVWGRHLRANRTYDMALAAFDRAAATGADPSVAALERARTLVALGRKDDGVTQYWSGLANLTPRGRDLYRQDLGWILSDDSLESFDSLSTGTEASWLTRMWGERDAAAVMPPGGRLGEHLRRWSYVHENFRVPSPWQRTLYTRVDFQFDGWVPCVESVPQFYERLPIKPPSLPGDIRTKEPMLDHRALIYLKHGDPFAMLVPANVEDIEGPEEEEFIVKDRFGLLTAEASMARSGIWVYWIEGAWRVLSFRGSAALGGHAPTTLSSYVRGNSAVWEAVALVVPEYARLASRLRVLEGRLVPPIFPGTCEAEFRTALKQSRADANLGIDTDSDTPPITRPWNAALRFFGLGGRTDRSGRALVSFAVPVEDLVADTLPNGFTIWPVDFRIVAYRPSDGRRIDMDSTRRFNAVAAPQAGFLSGHFELPLDDGSWQLAVIVRQRGDTTAGTYALRRNLVVGGAATLALSDVVTGREGQPAWRAPDGAFPVNTLGTWVEGGTVELWYEVRGLSEGDSYRTTIEVIPSERRLGDPLRIATEDRAAGAVTTVRKSMGLDRLRPGLYKLMVTVEHEGVRAVREQDVLIVEAP